MTSTTSRRRWADEARDRVSALLGAATGWEQDDDRRALHRARSPAGAPRPTAPCGDVGGGDRRRAFRSIFRRHPAGVAVVALRDGDRPVGFTATSVISVSAEPAAADLLRRRDVVVLAGPAAGEQR